MNNEGVFMWQKRIATNLLSCTLNLEKKPQSLVDAQSVAYHLLDLYCEEYMGTLISQIESAATIEELRARLSIHHGNTLMDFLEKMKGCFYGRRTNIP